MKLRGILSGIEIADAAADLDMEFGGICYDSRNAAPGVVFFAVRGYQTDGHAYIGAACAKGAAAVVCETAPDADIPYVLVTDSRLALAIASANWFGNPGGQMKLIGVTGTNGKTTTTVLLKKMLEDCLDAKVGLIGTNRNMIGARELDTEHTTPESYELQSLLRDMADSGCEYVVMEVSSHALALQRAAGLRFAVGIFTNLTSEHLDFHGSMEEYARCKSLLFAMCDTGIFNLDDDFAGYMIENADCEVFTYSAEKNEADLVAKDIRLAAEGVRFCALTPGLLERVSLPIPGRFTVYNALAVISCALALGIPVADAAGSLKDAKGVKGRVEVVPTNGDYTIIIDYAHTPDALENVLKAMSEIAEGRVVAVFGCGGDRDKTKRPMMGEVAARCADYVIVTTDNPRTEEASAIIADITSGLEGTKTPRKIIEDRREAIAYAIDNHKRGDIIVLAGKGHETYQIIGQTRHHMDEREIVAEHLGKSEV